MPTFKTLKTNLKKNLSDLGEVQFNSSLPCLKDSVEQNNLVSFCKRYIKSGVQFNSSLPCLQGRGRGGVDHKKSAFTLAEVLITLGIIGVVAAMTLPTLIQNHKKRVAETRLKTTYSQVSQMLQLVNVENDMAFNPITEEQPTFYTYDYSAEVFDKYFASKLKIVKEFDKGNIFIVCNSKGKGCEHSNTSCKYVLLANGAGLCTAVHPVSKNLDFYVIINPSKSNLVAGRDVFGIGTTRDVTENNYDMQLSTTLDKYYTEDTRNEFIQACSASVRYPRPYVNKGYYDREFYCFDLVYRNNWKIPDDYPVKF